MALISTKIHGVLDYAGGLGSLAAPKLIGDRRAATLMSISGAGTLTTSALTDYELGVRRAIPMRVHLMIDAATGSLLLGGAVALRRRGAGLLDCLPLALAGLAEVAGAALTSSRPTPAPGPPVAEPREIPDDDVLVAREESAAAAEEELVENASHGDGGGNPLRDALTPELETDRSGASYGRADDEGGPDDY